MKKAFTLIELLVVVLIIGILSAIALPQYQTSVDKTRYTTMMAAVRAAKDAQELYYLANGYYTTDLHDLEEVLPAQCTIQANNITAQCGSFKINLPKAGGAINAELISSVNGIGNVFKMYYDHIAPGYITCYAYSEDGERGRRLCKSLGGTQVSSQENESCDGDCTIYKL